VALIPAYLFAELSEQTVRQVFSRGISNFSRDTESIRLSGRKDNRDYFHKAKGFNL